MSDDDKNQYDEQQINETDGADNAEATELIEVSQVSESEEMSGNDEISDSAEISEEQDNADVDYDDDNDVSQQKRQKSKAPVKKLNIKKEILSWTATILIAIFIAIFINAYVFRASQVSGTSMLQTLTNEQMVFISRLPYIFGEPEYEDIIVFDSEKNERNFFLEIKESLQYNAITYKLGTIEHPQKYWIKRIVGLPGDVIEIKVDGVYRNGVLLAEDYVNPNETPNYAPWAGRSWTVKEGELFVMGDNRNHSQDGRVIGVIPEACVLGKVVRK